MFPIVAEKYNFVIGIDTHARKHIAVIVNNLGVTLYTREIKVTLAQMTNFVDWAVKQTKGNVLFAIEGTSSYGETLTSILLARNLHTVEVKPPKTKSRGGEGKTDQIDAELAALSTLRLQVKKLSIPRVGDTRKALRVLLGARRQMVTQRSMSKNALTAIVRGINLGVDARKPLTMNQYQVISAWHIQTESIQTESGIAQSTAKIEAKRLAKQVVSLIDDLDKNKQSLEKLVRTLAPSLLDEPGIGPITLAQVLCSYSHKGRIRSAEAFASLAGTAPIPANSGNTVHYRLNKYGDRQLNNVLHTIVMARMRTDENTIAYVEKRTKDGMSIRDIRRSLKRYVARSLFRKLEALKIEP